MDCFLHPSAGQNYVVVPDEDNHETKPSSSIETQRHIGLPGRHPGLADENIRATHQWSRPNDARAQTILNAPEGQNTLVDHDQYSGFGMHVAGQLWPVNTECGVDPAVPYHVPSPCGSLMDTATSIPHRTANGYFPNQISSNHPNLALFRSDFVMMQDMSLPQFSHHRYPSDAVYTKEEQGYASNTSTATTRVEDIVARIGSVLSNGKFVCDAEECGGQTFARPAELRRHHTTLHATNKPNFWCHVPTCRRGIRGRGGAFHRKDKLAAHIQSMHSRVQQGKATQRFLRSGAASNSGVSG
ncbi:hypothetical protein DE146DRAFT_650488 [Phaeosphaeria sp. MPI-PUGE-AT-0046c]|nr:hypothetical protein DE146DRAFT_650488 [Phaeosphaeria sp. MPI-PUGE-AT-0046c]